MGQPKLRTILAVAGAICFIIYTFAHIYLCFDSLPKYGHLIGIDAGSTRTELHLYEVDLKKKWDQEPLWYNFTTWEAEHVDLCVVPIGIADYVAESDVMPNALVDCMRNLTQTYDLVKSRVFTYLGASAGMRILNATDPEMVTAIFDRIKTKFDEFGVQTKQLSIISGEEEGFYTWIMANRLNDTLTLSTPTSGILYMGDSSIQQAHQIESNADWPIFDYKFDYYSSYSVLSDSNLCFGAKQAIFRYLSLLVKNQKSINSTSIEVPCFPLGFVTSSYNNRTICSEFKHSIPTTTKTNHIWTGTGNYEQCRALIVETMLNSSECERQFEYCFERTNLPRHQRYFALSTYYNTMEQLLVIDKSDSTVDYDRFQAKKREICNSSLSELNLMNLNGNKIHELCFLSTYIEATLSQVYGLTGDDWRNLRFLAQIQDRTVGWIDGMAQMVLNQNRSQFYRHTTDEFACFDSWFCLLLLTCFLLIIFIICMCNKLN